MEQLITAIFDTHPWHVPTTHFPIALTGAALLFLVLALLRRNEMLERAAFYNMALASITIVLAGVTGIRDVQVRFEGDAPYANVKIFLAISLLLLTVGIVVNRWRKPDILWTPGTMVLYLVGFAGAFAIASLLGFLGGVILYGF